MVRRTEQPEHIDISRPLVAGDFIEVMDVAALGWGMTARIDAMLVSGNHCEPLNGCRIVPASAKFEDLAGHVLKAVVEVGPCSIEQ